MTTRVRFNWNLAKHNVSFPRRRESSL